MSTEIIVLAVVLAMAAIYGVLQGLYVWIKWFVLYHGYFCRYFINICRLFHCTYVGITTTPDLFSPHRTLQFIRSCKSLRFLWENADVTSKLFRSSIYHNKVPVMSSAGVSWAGPIAEGVTEKLPVWTHSADIQMLHANCSHVITVNGARIAGLRVPTVVRTGTQQRGSLTTHINKYWLS
jgi:hypothetical protein